MCRLYPFIKNKTNFLSLYNDSIMIKSNTNNVFLVLEKEIINLNYEQRFFNPLDNKKQKVKVLYNNKIWWADPDLLCKRKINEKRK